MAGLFFTKTTTQSKAEINLELARLGAFVSAASKGEEFRFVVSAPKENLAKALELFESFLKNAMFNENEFARIKHETLQGFDRISENPNTVMMWTSDSEPFGTNSSSGITPKAAKKLWENVTLDDVKAMYARLLMAPIEVAVAGDFNVDDAVLLTSLDFLSVANKAPAQTERVSENYAPVPQETRIRFLEYPGLAQSAVKIGYRHDLTSPGQDLKWYYYDLLNQPLGDGATGRLFHVLREEMGLTYGVNSSFDVSRYYPNTFAVAYSTPTGKTSESIEAAFAVLQEYHQTGPSDEEWSAVLESEAASLAAPETVSDQLGLLNVLLDTGGASDYQELNLAGARDLTPEQRLEMVQTHFDPAMMQVMVVGDKAVLEDLRSLGYPIDVVNIEGEILDTIIVQ